MLDAMGIRVFEPLPMAPTQVDEPPSNAAEIGDTVPTPQREPSVVEPIVHGVASMDWATLETTVATCRACTLCETRKQTVFGVGHPSAHWMIVGEAPGEQEDNQGEPFVGSSGQLLDAMLQALGLTRNQGPPSKQVYIANTVKCRPPKNRNPTPNELRTCEPYLRRQIALVKPRVILAMGRFAVQSLLRTDEAIGRLRERVHALEGTPLVVTYHPAYLLRNPIDKARVWDDLCLAAEIAEQASVSQIDR